MNTHRNDCDYHHFFTPKSRGGSGISTNLLYIKIIRHRAWHCLWDIYNKGKKVPRTLSEILILLEKTSDENFVMNKYWRMCWYTLKPSEVYQLLLRVKRAKLNQKRRFYL